MAHIPNWGTTSPNKLCSLSQVQHSYPTGAAAHGFWLIDAANDFQASSLDAPLPLIQRQHKLNPCLPSGTRQFFDSAATI